MISPGGPAPCSAVRFSKGISGAQVSRLGAGAGAGAGAGSSPGLVTRMRGSLAALSTGLQAFSFTGDSFPSFPSLSPWLLLVAVVVVVVVVVAVLVVLVSPKAVMM